MSTSRLIFPAWSRSSSRSQRAKIIFTSKNYLRILVILTVILTGDTTQCLYLQFSSAISHLYENCPFAHYHAVSYAWVNSALSCVCKYVESRGRPGLDRASKSRKNSCHSFQELIKNHAGTAEGRSGCLRSTEIPPRTPLTEEIAFQHFDVEHACDVTQYYITI